MNKEVRTVAGTEVTFADAAPLDRWVFAGSINPGGYLTVEDAMVEAEAQLEGRLQGRLAAEAGHTDVPQRTHRQTWDREVAPVARRY